MLLGTLGAFLLGCVLPGKKVVKGDDGFIRAG